MGVRERRYAARIGTLPSTVGLGGVGNYVWEWDHSFTGPLRIYSATDLSAPIQTFLSDGDTFISSGTIIADLHGTVRLISLGASITTGASLTTRQTGPEAFAADADGHWVIGNGEGVVIDDAAVLSQSWDTYSLGLARSLASSSNAQAAIATASGHTLVMSVGATTAVTGMLQVLASQTALSDDGSILVATDLSGGQTGDDRSLHTFSTADGSLLYTWPYQLPAYGTTLLGFSFAPKGRVICQMLGTCDVNACWIPSRLYTDPVGNTFPSYGPTPYTTSVDLLTEQTPRFSPDGVHAVFGPIGYGGQATTQVYSNGSLVTAVSGIALAWLDDDHFIDATYRYQSQGGFGTYVQDTVQIYDSTGTVIGSAMLPDIQGLPLVPVGGTLVFCPWLNEVLDYSTGAVYWKGDPTVHTGVAVGEYVLYTKNERVFIDRFWH